MAKNLIYRVSKTPATPPSVAGGLPALKGGPLNYSEMDFNWYTLAETKVDVVAGKGLSSVDFTPALKSKLDGISTGATAYTHPIGDGNLHVPATGTSSAGEVLTAGATAGSVSWTPLTKSSVQLGNVDNTSDADKPISNAVSTALSGKSNASHTHDPASIVGLGSAAVADIGVGAGDVVGVDNFPALLAAAPLPSYTFTSVEFQRLSGQIWMDLALGMIDVVSLLGLEVGDVVRFSGPGLPAANAKLFTVTTIIAPNIIQVNGAHAGGAGPLALDNYTGACTIQRVCKWYEAGLSIGQAWVDVTPYRSGGGVANNGVTYGVTYTNNSPRALVVVISGNSPHYSNTATYTVDGVITEWSRAPSGTMGMKDSVTFIVPPGSTYSCNYFQKWVELR